MRYERREDFVDAERWNGDNRQEMIDFFSRWLPKDQGPYFSRDDYPEDEYNTISFYWGDDIEVDPGCWVVVHESSGDVKISWDRKFWKDYKMVGTDG